MCIYLYIWTCCTWRHSPHTCWCDDGWGQGVVYKVFVIFLAAVWQHVCFWHRAHGYETDWWFCRRDNCPVMLSWATLQLHSERLSKCEILSEQLKSVFTQSAVPQATVLALLMFLIYIPDFPSALNAQRTIKLFANNRPIYRSIQSLNDQVQLQRHLDALHL